MTKSKSHLLTRRDWMRRSLSGLCFIVPVLANDKLGQPILASGGPWFTDVAKKRASQRFTTPVVRPVKNYLVETMNGGVAIFDYNNDGLMDILLVNGSTFQLLDDPSFPRTMSRLFRNNGDGTFTDVTRQSGLINDRVGPRRSGSRLRQ